MNGQTLVLITDLALQFAKVNRATFHQDGMRPESDTDHTVMLGLLAVDIAGRHPELGLSIPRLCALALVHDFPEVHAGDTDTMGGLTPTEAADKAQREAASRSRLGLELDGSAILTLIDTYQERIEPEARFLYYLDKITPKLTHALNGGAAIRRSGRSVEWLRERHKAQGMKLAADYPEFAGVLAPLFDSAAALSEAGLE